MVLSIKSKHLMKHFIHNKKLAIKQTRRTDDIFTVLYYKILDANNFVKQYKNSLYDISITKITNTSKITKPININISGLPESIKKQIWLSSNTEISYSFKLAERKIKVVFIVEEANINTDVYNKHIETIIMWLHIIKDYASLSCSSNLVIYIYFTSIEKKLPTTNMSILDESNVNTAITTSCQPNTEIVIYRKEEWLKVLMHESAHSFGLDFSEMNNDECTKRILHLFPVDSKVNLYESYAEFWAETMNVLFCSFLNLKNKNNVNEFLTNTEFLMNIERKYSFFQLVKILKFMGLEYKDLYSKSKSSTLLRNTLYKENTNVLSYYVIKTILINSYQSFLYWCKTNNDTLLQFKQTVDNQNKYCAFIEKKYKSASMIEGVDDAERAIIKSNNDLYLLDTMRMSICEMG